MPRPKNAPYTLGKIAFAIHPTKAGHKQARGYFSDANGRRREVTASGKSNAAAKRELQRKVNAARDEHQGGDSQLNQDTKVGKAADLWLDHCRRRREPLSANTLEQYEGNIRRYVKGSEIEHLSLTEVNAVARLEGWLEGVADASGEGAARAARKVMSGILGLAERRGAIPASVMHRVETPGAKPGSAGDRKCTDSDCDYDCGKRHLDTDRAFTPDEAHAVQVAADASGADIGDLAAFLFGTGARISEALHCTFWVDVDLGAQTVRVRGTKTAKADRVLAMSDELTERLRQRAGLHGTKGLVFGVTRYATKAGEPRDKRNVSAALRLALGKADCRWAASHTFRRTVATWLDENGAGLAEIANQLGHGNTNVTATYLGRTVQPTRAASVMKLPAKPKLRAISGE